MRGRRRRWRRRSRSKCKESKFSGPFKHGKKKCSCWYGILVEQSGEIFQEACNVFRKNRAGGDSHGASSSPLKFSSLLLKKKTLIQIVR